MIIKLKLLGMIVLVVILTNACSSSKQNQFEWFEGRWKVENSEQYESWEKISYQKWQGVGYKLVDGQKQVLENLAIVITDSSVLYQATVLNQNEGKTISFKLNQDLESIFSFENKSHDFPKIIRYQKIDENQLFVEVLGDKDQGFSYSLFRQPSE